MNPAKRREQIARAVEELLDHLAQAQIYLADLDLLLDRYTEAHSLDRARAVARDGKRPMWPGLPTSEQDTSRDGRGSYIYLYWRTGEEPRPGGRPQRKTYLGADPANVALGRRMVNNRHLYLQLRAARRDLAQRIDACTVQLQTAATHAAAMLDRPRQLFDRAGISHPIPRLESEGLVQSVSERLVQSASEGTGP